MKKLFILMVLVLTIFGLASCKKEVSLQTVIDSVEITFSGNDSLNSVTTDLSLPESSTLNKKVIFVWMSDQPMIVDYQGRVNRPDETTEVKLTLTLSLKGIYMHRDFIVTIIGKNTEKVIDHIDDFVFMGYNDYYDQLNSSSNVITDLALQLRNTISYVSYGDARYVYVKYDNDSQVVLYDVPSSNTYRKVPSYGEEGWGDGGKITTPTFSLSLNREHVWACNDMRIMPTNGSRRLSEYVGFNLLSGTFDYRPGNTDRGHFTDLHNLWNALAGPNGTHNDHFYGEENGKSASSYLKNSIFYPGDEYRGDVARILFYMTLMYPHLTLVEKGSPLANEGTIYYGYLDVLLRWNEEDPVSYYETSRNETIYELQGNRNPFVDFYSSNFADLIFALGDPNVLD